MVGRPLGARAGESGLRRRALGFRKLAAQHRDAPGSGARHRPAGAEAGGGGLEAGGGRVGVPIGDPGEQTAASPLVDRKPVAAPARGGRRRLAAAERRAQQDADSLLPELAFGGLDPAGKLAAEVRPDDRHRIVAVPVPLLRMEDLLRGARRIDGEGVVEQPLPAPPSHLEAEGGASRVAEQELVAKPGRRRRHLLLARQRQPGPGASLGRTLVICLLRQHQSQELLRLRQVLERLMHQVVEHDQGGVALDQRQAGHAAVRERIGIGEAIEIEMLVLDGVGQLVHQQAVLHLARQLGAELGGDLPAEQPARPIDHRQHLAMRIVEAGDLAGEQPRVIGPQVHALGDQPESLEAQLDRRQAFGRQLRREIGDHLAAQLRLRDPAPRHPPLEPQAAVALRRAHQLGHPPLQDSGQRPQLRRPVGRAGAR